ATNAAEESPHSNPFWPSEVNNAPGESFHDSFWLSRRNNASVESPLTWISENCSAKTPTRNTQRSRHLTPAPGVPIFAIRAADMEEPYDASVLEMQTPGSPTYSTTGSSIEEQMPTSTRKPPSSMTQKVILVLGFIKEQRLSLPAFLEELFGSEDEAIKHWSHQFYNKNGPRRIVEIWGRKLHRHKDWDFSFVNSAVDVVVCRTKRDLNHCKNRVIGDTGCNKAVGDDGGLAPAYRLPHNNVTEKNIEQVLSNGFLDTYASHASFLMRLLDGVLHKNKNKGKGKGKGKVNNNNNKHMDGEDEDTEDGEDGEDGEDEEDGKDVHDKEDEKDKEDPAVAEEDKYKDGAFVHRRSRNPSSVRGCIAAMLMFVRSWQCNAFQTVMGIFLHCIGCPRRGLEALSSLGLSVSYDQVHRALRSLTKDALTQVQKAVLENDWYVVYDNINIAMKHHHQRADKRDTFDNGTAATVILIPSENAKNDKPIPVCCPKTERPEPSALIFFPTPTDRAMFRAACRTHLSAAIARSLPHASTGCVIPMQTLDEIDVCKTIAFPLPTMKIDESTISGNLAVLESITRANLHLSDTWFDSARNIIVGGDQMTVARLLSLKIHRAIESDPYGGLDWVHPTPQLFHLQMTLCSTIYKTHLGADANTPGSLASFISLLESKGFNKEKPEFKATNELMRIVFDAMSKVLWETLHDADTSVELDMSSVVDTIINAISDLKQAMPSLNGRLCTTADINALYFLRDMTVFIEFSDAIKAGDRGRIRCILPTIALMMHGGGNSNYALELLRLLYGMRHAWTPEWEKRVLSSMLVNPKGVPYGWMPTDMYQENNNYLIKTIFAAKGPNMSWEYLRDKISPNIRTFQDIARLFERGVDSKYNSTVHKKPSTKEDVDLVKGTLQFCGILWVSKQDNRPPPALVVDLQRVGAEKMTSGAIGRFLKKNERYDAVDMDEVEANEHVVNE
ncbi:hypothetical protein BGZ82_001909, partial [Podila clonocystis]